ncbi:MAG: 6-phospho-beta-galactosidase [Sphaerochaeta sp.]|nr:6-phospho-beta-galactosidase [Sphaerochaeta sp.]
MKISKDFIIGAATAAYQAEGAVHKDGRIPIYWDREFHQEGSRFNADTASDFYHTFDQDFAMAKSIGLKAIRISIAWSRVICNENDEINEEGLKFYDKLIDSCLHHGLEPFVTLHHFDTPLIFFDKGDWLAEKTIDHFLAFAKVCFERFGTKVRHWITINEPWSVACGQYIIGHFPPHIQYDVEKAVRALHNMMIAHCKCAALYKSYGYGGKIGIVHILESKYPLDHTPGAAMAAEREDALANAFLLDATLLGGYTEKTLATINAILSGNGKDRFHISRSEYELLEKGMRCTDFLGVNYYASHFLRPWDGASQIVHNGTGEKGTSCFKLQGIGERKKNPSIPTTDWDWPIFPAGLYDMLTRIRNDYKNPVMYITENGIGAHENLEDGTVDDVDRISYLQSHLEAVLKSRQEGTDVRGFFIWSLFDLFSWTNGYNKRYGLLYTDFTTNKRYLKKSAHWIKELVHD